MELDVALSMGSAPTLEDLSIKSWLMATNRSMVDVTQKTLPAVQDELAGDLSEILGGVSSVNTRLKMMKELVDVRFLTALSKEHSPVSSAVNKVRFNGPGNSIYFIKYIHCIFVPGFDWLVPDNNIS